MRKRREVEGASAEVQVAADGVIGVSEIARGPAPAPAAGRAKATVEGGLVFLECPHKGCGLVHSAKTAKEGPPPAGKTCFRCGGYLGDWPQAELDKLAGKGNGALPKPEREAPSVLEGGPQCGTCGVALTQTALGDFCPKGHPRPRAAPVPEPFLGDEKLAAKMPAIVIPEISSPSPKSDPPDAQRCDRITVTRGADVFAVSEGCSFTIGPFSVTTELGPGETAAGAAVRTGEFLDMFADIEFARRAKAFAERLEKLAGKR